MDKYDTKLYEKTSHKAKIDKNSDEKEKEELEKIYNHSLDKHKHIMESTEESNQEINGEALGKEGYSSKQRINRNNFSAKVI